MSVTVNKLSYVYSPNSPFEKVALDEIDLIINDNEFFGIIGHTGSGKSTLVSHFNALTKIQSGTIFIEGHELTGKGMPKTKAEMKALSKAQKKEARKKKKPDFRALRQSVGMVFQYPEYQLFDETVFKDVAFGPKNVGITEPKLTERVKAAIGLVGLDYEEIKDRSPFDLSGGQKRRVAIAGVLAMKPKTLILDEPTAGLDPRGKAEILQLITVIKSTMSLTVIMISHNMDEVSRCCDRIAVMSNGQLKCVLPPRELFSQRELLTSLSIEMPLITEIACELSSRGLDVKQNVVTEEQLIEGIVAALANNHAGGEPCVK